jgi:hypothetical protein
LFSAEPANMGKHSPSHKYRSGNTL